MKTYLPRFVACLGLAAALFCAPAARIGGTVETASVTPPAASGPLAASASSTAFLKDETVYAMLAPDGSVRRIEVVNRLSGKPGTWIDPGAYTAVETLTAGIVPLLGDSRVTVVSTDGADVYYQGTMDPAAVLPFRIEVGYTLDGKPVSAEQLSGADGAAVIRLSVRPDPGSAVPAGQLVCQAAVTLDMRHAHDIRAEGATRMVAGRSCVLSFTLLPGREAEWTVSFTASAFRMDAITLTALPLDPASTGTAGMAGGIAEMRDGAEELADAGETLAEGLAGLTDGLATLDQGIADAASGIRALADGIAALQAGGSTLAEQTAALSAGMEALEPALLALGTQSGQLAEGYTQLSGTLASLTVPVEQSAVLAACLAQMDGLNEGLSAAAAGLGTIGTQYTALSDGLSALAGGTAGLSGGITETGTGAEAAADGIAALAAGSGLLAEDSGALPDGAAGLAEGQRALAEALDTLKTEVDATLGDADAVIPSFAAPAGPAPHSLQFLFQIPAIDPPAPAPVPAEDVDKDTGYIKRLLDLFRG